MDQLFSVHLHAGVLGTVIILVVLFLRPLLKNAPRRIVCALWLLAGLRLLLPFEMVSNLSLQPRYNPDTVLTTVAPDNGPDTPAPTVVPEQKPEEIPEQKPEQMPDLPETPVDPTPEYKPSGTQPPQTTTTATNTPKPVTFTRLLPHLWGLGTLIFLCYGVVSYLALCYRVRTATKRDDGTMECDRINSPFLLGYFRPRIYVPLGLCDQDRTFVIAHEETHRRRGDNWWKLLGMICLALHWYNPLVWVGYSMMCRDIEAACDERVIEAMDIEDRKAYSIALLNSGKRLSGVLVCPVAFGEVDLKKRIKRVLSYRKPGLLITALAFAAVMFVACCFLTSPADAVTELSATEATEPPAATGPTVSPTEPPLDENGIVQCYLLTEVKKYWPDGKLIETNRYQFDEHGRIVYKCRVDGILDTVSMEYAYAYDDHGRLISEGQIGYDSINYIYQYSDEGRVLACTEKTYYSETVRRFSYDAKGRVIEMTTEVSDSNFRTTFRYDDKGRLVGIGDAYGEVFSYDEQNRVTQHVDNLYNSAYRYEYDNAGRLTRMVKGLADEKDYDTDWNCTYDDSGKLIAIDAPDCLEIALEYTVDENGNVTTLWKGNGIWMEFHYEMIEVTAKEAASMPVCRNVFYDGPSKTDYVGHMEDYYLPKGPYQDFVSEND